jgi:hypothetical protein
MKTYKVILVCFLTLATAALTKAATPAGQDRPAQVAAADWIKISETAGVAVTGTSRDKIVGKLYVKRGNMWFEVSVENSPRVVE